MSSSSGNPIVDREKRELWEQTRRGEPVPWRGIRGREGKDYSAPPEALVLSNERKWARLQRTEKKRACLSDVTPFHGEGKKESFIIAFNYQKSPATLHLTKKGNSKVSVKRKKGWEWIIKGRGLREGNAVVYMEFQSPRRRATAEGKGKKGQRSTSPGRS